MVQQLSLVSAIDEESLQIFLTTISSFTGTPHIAFENVNLTYLPTEITDSSLIAVEADSETEKQQKRINLSTVLANDKSQSPDTNNISLSTLLQEKTTGWTLSTCDVPLAGNNNKEVSSQAIYETVVGETESGIDTFMKDLGYRYDYVYKKTGYRVFHPTMMIICDIFKVISLTISDENVSTEKDLTEKGYMVKCYANIDNATDIESIKLATNNLIQFKKVLQKYLELQIPDRKAMDFSVKDY
ncbi:hypothetical protein ACO0QE_001606 [Hanseniaspora vineae]